MSENVERLLARTREMIDAHMDQEAGHSHWARLAADVEEVERAYRIQIANKVGDDGKPLYSNEAKREAALREVMQRSHKDLIAERDGAEQFKRAAAAAYERLHEEVKTLRVVVAHESAVLELEAAKAESLSMPRLRR